MGLVEKAEQCLVDNALDVPMGTVVRAWREARELPITKLAQLAGLPVTKDYLSKLEHGKIRQAGRHHRGKIAEALGIQEEDLVLRRMPPENASSQPETPIQSTGAESLAALDPSVPLRDWMLPSYLLKPALSPSRYPEVLDLESLIPDTLGRDERTILELLTHEPPRAARGRTLAGELLHRILWSYLSPEALLHLGASRTEQMMTELIGSGLKDFKDMTNPYPRDPIGEDIARRLALAEARMVELWKKRRLL